MHQEIKIKKLIWPVIIILIGIVASKFSDFFISNYYPGRPILPDVVHYAFPYIQFLEYFADIVMILMVALFALDIHKQKMWRKLPQFMASYGIYYTLRAFLNLVTPIGKPLGNLTSHGILKDVYIQYGMFPSGHFGFTTLIFLWMLKYNSKYRNVSFILLLLEAITMLLSWGHYTIDMVGAFLLAFFVVDRVSDYYISRDNPAVPRKEF